MCSGTRSSKPSTQKKNAMPCLPWCNECEFPFFSFSPQKTRPLKRPWNSDSSHENSHRQMPPWKAARKGEKKVVGQTLQVLEPCAKKEEWWWREGVKGYLCHGLWNNPHKTGLITLLLLSLTFFLITTIPFSTLTFMNPDVFWMRLLSPAARSNGRASSILP